MYDINLMPAESEPIRERLDQGPVSAKNRKAESCDNIIGLSTGCVLGEFYKDLIEAIQAMLK